MKLLKKEAYRQTAAYMLEKVVKLEQEIISYYLGKDKEGGPKGGNMED